MGAKKSCSNAQGEKGRCMFVWECIKTDGKHLGTCTDGFLYGSCCGKPDHTGKRSTDIRRRRPHYNFPLLLSSALWKEIAVLVKKNRKYVYGLAVQHSLQFTIPYFLLSSRI